MTVSEAKDELVLLDDFLKSSTYKDFVFELIVEVSSAEGAVFDMVPQTLGDQLEREQKVGLRNFARNLQSWFEDRREAIVQLIADDNQTVDTP